MGCWNETCWLSNLPIMDGDLCYLVLLAENKGYGSNRTRGLVYNYAMWAPFALPILGKYDGYGRLEKWDPEDPALEVLRVYLQDNVIPYAQGENTHHDLPVSKEMFENPDWVSQIQQRMSHGAGIQMQGYQEPRLGAVLIRGDVYDALSKRPYESWKGGTVSVESTITQLQELTALAVKRKVFLRKDLNNSDLPAVERIQIKTDLICLEQKMERLHGIPREWSPHKVFNALMVLGDEKVTRRLAEFLQVGGYTQDLRKLWHPTCGSGSQDTDWDLHRDFAQIVYGCAKTSEYLSHESDDEWDDAVYPELWKRFPPSKVWEYEGRCEISALKDSTGASIPGIKGWGSDGYTCLFVVEDVKRQEYSYVLYDDESGEWKTVLHTVAPHSDLTRYMINISAPSEIES